MKITKPLVFNTAAGATSLALLWLVSNDVTLAAAGQDDHAGEQARDNRRAEDAVEDGALAKLRDGRRIFRYDTFGDQAFWGDGLKLHQAIAGATLGGVGPGVSPNTALAVGLKVDSDCAIRRWTTRLPPVLDTGWTAGPIAI